MFLYTPVPMEKKLLANSLLFDVELVDASRRLRVVSTRVYI